MLLILIAVVCATLMWPVSRWIVRHGGRTVLYSLWLSVTAAIISGLVSLKTGQSLLQPTVWYIGIIIGFAFATGFCLVIMYCLKIGPGGPTVAMNNMGLVWPVLLDAIWLKPHSLNTFMMTGLTLIIFSLIIFGFGNMEKSNKSCIPKISVRWMYWAFLGWILAGVSMTGQLLGSIYVPDSPFALIFAFTLTAAVILFLIVFKSQDNYFNKREIIAGGVMGFLLAAAGAATLTALRYLNAGTVFSFTVVTPIILMLIIGRFVYHESLAKKDWLACFLSICGLINLVLGQNNL